MSVAFASDAILAGCVDGRLRSFEIRTGKLLVDDVKRAQAGCALLQLLTLL